MCLYYEPLHGIWTLQPFGLRFVPKAPRDTEPQNPSCTYSTLKEPCPFRVNLASWRAWVYWSEPGIHGEPGNRFSKPKCVLKGLEVPNFPNHNHNSDYRCPTSYYITTFIYYIGIHTIRLCGPYLQGRFDLKGRLGSWTLFLCGCVFPFSISLVIPFGRVFVW